MTPGRFKKLRSVLLKRQPNLTVLTENVHKEHNLSAILRSCDATGVLEAHAVSSDGAVRRHHMVSGGARKWVQVLVHPDIHTACRNLRADGFEILAAHFSETARDFRAIDYTRRVAVMFGSELWGVSNEAAGLADGHVVIPMEGMVASLNVSVAAALILYEAQRQRRLAGLYAECRLNPATFSKTLFEWAYPEVAERCRSKGLPYPELSDDGMLTTNPLNKF